MSKIIPIGVTRKQIREATDAAWLRLARLDDPVRLLQCQIECIGRFLVPRYRAEFLHALKYIAEGLPMDEASIRCASTCLDVLAERYRGAA
jgi:hypothetical protein